MKDILKEFDINANNEDNQNESEDLLDLMDSVSMK